MFNIVYYSCNSRIYSMKIKLNMYYNINVNINDEIINMEHIAAMTA